MGAFSTALSPFLVRKWWKKGLSGSPLSRYTCSIKDFLLSAPLSSLGCVCSCDNERRRKHGLPLRDTFSLSAWKNVHPSGESFSGDARSVPTQQAGFHPP